MEEGGGRHRRWALAALLLAALAVVGTLLPWLGSPLAEALPKGIRTASDSSEEAGPAVIAALMGRDFVVRGIHGEGKYVVAFLLLGLGACWVAFARWLRPLSTRPVPALLLACLLLATGAVLVLLQGLGVWTAPSIARAFVHVEYGWWITLVSSVLAAFCALLALRSAVAEGGAPDRETAA